MTDIEHLRLGFCSLIMQAKGSLVSSFVAWLDLKVAEYKVYGHMILTEDNENEEAGAWQMTSAPDPSHWPRSLPAYSDPTAASALTRGYNPPQTATRGRKTPYSRFPMRGRPRPARPKSVTNILKTAISRSSRAMPMSSSAMTISAVQPAAQPAIQPAFPTSVPESSTSSNMAVSGAESALAQTSTAGLAPTSSIIKTDTDSEQTVEQTAAQIKEEPSLLMTVQSHDSTGDEQLSENVGDEEGMWLNESLNESAAMLDTAPSTSYHVQQTLPSTVPRVASRGRGRGSTSASRLSVGTSSSAGLASSQSRARPSKDSVNELLQSHTIQTESEHKYMCSICGNRFKSSFSIRRHIKAEHLNILEHCPFCPQAFKWRWQVFKHLASVHQITDYKL